MFNLKKSIRAKRHYKVGDPVILDHDILITGDQGYDNARLEREILHGRITKISIAHTKGCSLYPENNDFIIHATYNEKSPTLQIGVGNKKGELRKAIIEEKRNPEKFPSLEQALSLSKEWDKDVDADKWYFNSSQDIPKL